MTTPLAASPKGGPGRPATDVRRSPGVVRSGSGRLETAVLVLFPASMPLAFRPFGPVQVIEVAALLLIALALTQRILTVGVTPPPGRGLWAVALLLAALAATPLAVDEDRAFRADVQLVLGIALSLGVLQVATTVGRVRMALACLAGFSVPIALLGLQDASKQEAQFGGTVVAGRAQGIFAQPNEFGLFAAMVFVVAVALTASRRKRSSRVLWAATSLVLFAALAVSLSRGAWLGAIAGVSGLLVLMPVMRRFALRSAPAVAVVLAVGIPLLPSEGQLQILVARLGTIFEGAENPYDERPGIYAEAVRLFVERPLVGHGPGSFPVASNEAFLEGNSGQAEHAHNALLTVAAETGVFGIVGLLGVTLAVLITVLTTVRTARDEGDQHVSALAAGSGAALLVVVAHGLIDYPLRNPLVFFLCWYLVGLVFALHQLVAEARPQGPAAPRTGQRGRTDGP